MGKKRSSAVTEKVPFIGVLQLPLDEADFPLILSVTPDLATLVGYIETLTDTGYEVVFRREPDSGEYTCILKGLYNNCPNAGHWLFSSGDSVLAAGQSACFKHFEIAKQAEWAVHHVSPKPRRYK